MPQMNGSEIIIRLLEKQGIEIVAGIPGGANLPLYHALSGSKIRHILARHEQGAGFIAHGMARSTGKAAVCFGTSGPGATNLLTAIADAKLDSVPIVAITGQVPSSMIGTDAFQEVDTYGMTLPITKHNFLVRSAEELLCVIPEAFRIAESGRPGPVVVDVPKDVQKESIHVDTLSEMDSPVHPKYELDLDDISLFNEMLQKSEKPVLLIGGGVIMSDAIEQVSAFARKNNIPVATTLMGLGCFPPDDLLYIGMVGMHGARYANMIMDETDLVIALGMRFDDRATGKVDAFCPNASIIHVDVDRSEIDKIKTSSLSIIADLSTALDQLLPTVEENMRSDWIEHVKSLKKNNALQPPKISDPYHPIHLLKTINQLADPDAIYTTDVGQHQMWAAQWIPITYPRQFLTSGGLGTMGFGMPAAIGAALANPEKQVICISGDGSILMNIQELATIRDHDLNVKILIFNNGNLGLVRQQQEYFYEKVYSGTQFESLPDFAVIASGFGIRSQKLGNEPDPSNALKEALDMKGPVLLDIPIHVAENVTPMVPPGSANSVMIGE
ncbi:biosynthetic-type acetolactate synthase large subunit [candidate division KSB1 bacterium]|nr:biosynthetic-type acetolactate synthase large subunit [candidate division KSB1 bacterium]